MNNIASKIQSDLIDKTTIVINGQRIEQFSNESILLSIDNVGAGFSFDVPFFPGTKEYRDIFRPFKYQSFQLYIGTELIMNGTIEKISPSSQNNSNSVNVQGRSKTGVLVDCSFEKGDTLEFIKADLQEIANTVVAKFGIETQFDDGPGPIFEKAGPDSPTTKIFEFLQNLARQRSLLMSQSNDGKLLFRRAKTTGSIVAELVEGQQGVIISGAEYDGTQRFSSYDVFGQEPGKNDNFAKLISKIQKKDVSQSVADNSTEDSNIFAIRPKSIKANDTNQGNIDNVALWSLSSDIATAIRIPIGYEGWLRPDGELWKENELISIQAPSLMIYKPFVMLIKDVLFISNPDSKTVNLELTLPEAYSDQIPEVFPWDE